MIIGHHPHVMQGIEVYQGRVIAYSLGNFIFDQRGKGTDRSFILAATFGKHGFTSARIIPLDRRKRYFPLPAEGPAGTGILDEVKKISGPLSEEEKNLLYVGLENLSEEAK